jgi:hypothetical protein
LTPLRDGYTLDPVTTTPSPTSPDYGRLIDELAAAGYSPADTFEELSSTVDYFARRGWDAVRHNGDSLSFARFSDEGARLMTTTLSGVIQTEASFSTDRHGLRMFTTAAELLP